MLYRDQTHMQPPSYGIGIICLIDRRSVEWHRDFYALHSRRSDAFAFGVQEGRLNPRLPTDV